MNKFAEKCPANPLELSRQQKTDFLLHQLPSHQLECCSELHCTFFFDGTNNNLDRDKPLQSHSNVARLYEVFEFQKNPYDGRSTTFRNYASGVGTEFKKEVGDTGVGVHKTAGNGIGWGGEARINWALLQLLNNVHQHYFTDIPLSQAISDSDLVAVKRMSGDLNMSLAQINAAGRLDPAMVSESYLSNKLNDPLGIKDITRDSQRKSELAKRRTLLQEKIAPLLKNKPVVKKIHVSVFGFSRGAAEARTFCNWLRDAVEPDFTLAGIPVHIDFLGIFDTVASVGVPQSVKEGIFSGHNMWGRDECLLVPSNVDRCVHLVAAQEVRGSFPLDLATTNIEIAYPGMHSDVGGGYAPNDQGKAPDYTDKLSQIPLCHMYREAVAAGVPLNVNAANVRKDAREAFNISPSLRQAFNDYIDATADLIKAPLTQVMHAHYGQYLRWRRLRLPGSLQAAEKQPYFGRASVQDKENLRSANADLVTEWRGLEHDEQANALCDYSQTTKMMCMMLPPLSGTQALREILFKNKIQQWKEVKPYWNNTSPLDPRIVKLFDDYVHDSRGGFRPTFDDDTDWQKKERKQFDLLKRKQAEREEFMQSVKNGTQIISDSKYGQKAFPPALTENEKQYVDNFEKSGAPAQQGMIEPNKVWGYLRWRGIYSPNHPVSVDQYANATENAIKDRAAAAGTAAKNAAEATGAAVKDGAVAAGTAVKNGAIAAGGAIKDGATAVGNVAGQAMDAYGKMIVDNPSYMPPIP